MMHNSFRRDILNDYHRHSDNIQLDVGCYSTWWLHMRGRRCNFELPTHNGIIFHIKHKKILEIFVKISYFYVMVVKKLVTFSVMVVNKNQNMY